MLRYNDESDENDYGEWISKGLSTCEDGSGNCHGDAKGDDESSQSSREGIK